MTRDVAVDLFVPIHEISEDGKLALNELLKLNNLDPKKVLENIRTLKQSVQRVHENGILADKIINRLMNLSR